MDLRSALGSLQLPVAGVGAFLTVVAVQQLATLPEPPAGSDGFVTGLAVFFLYALAFVGFVVFSLGLAIPPGDGYGITFRRGQRLLFVTGAAATVAALIVPILAFGVVFAAAIEANFLPFYAWFGCHALAVLSVGIGLSWRGYEAAAPAVARRVNG